VSLEGATVGNVDCASDREPGPSSALVRSEVSQPFAGLGPAGLWEDRCRDGETSRWPAAESIALLEALRQYIVAGDDVRLRRAAKSWAVANPSVAVLLRRLSCLRELFDDEGIARLPDLNDRFRRGLDKVTAIATETATSALADAALTDTLTGAGNRRALQETAPVLFEQASHSGGVVSVAVIDLKGLKAINDTQGHAAGDKALAGFTTSLRAAMRENDRLFRVGGDEFVLLLPGATSEAVTKVMGRAVRLNAPDFSWGTATFPLEGREIDPLLDLADSRLYRSRHQEGYYGIRSSSQDLTRVAAGASLPPAAADGLSSSEGKDKRRRRRLVPVILGGAVALVAVLLAMSMKPPSSNTLLPRYSPSVTVTSKAGQSTPAAAPRRPAPGAKPAGAPAAPPARTSGSSVPNIPAATTPAPPPPAASQTGVPAPRATTPATTPATAPASAGGSPQSGGQSHGNGAGNGVANGHGGSTSRAAPGSPQSTTSSGAATSPGASSPGASSPGTGSPGTGSAAPGNAKK
jgi:diguanylate cyclase (GGDEF)-like protein